MCTAGRADLERAILRLVGRHYRGGCVAAAARSPGFAPANFAARATAVPGSPPRPFTKNDLAALVSLTGKNAGLVKRSLRGAEAAVT
jgi:hypothetical protein